MALVRPLLGSEAEPVYVRCQAQLATAMSVICGFTEACGTPKRWLDVATCHLKRRALSGECAMESWLLLVLLAAA